MAPRVFGMNETIAIDQKIAQLNQRLKAARLGLQIERRGQILNLRGTFPPKPGSHRLRPHQQRLSLGYPATNAGLKQAEQEVKIIAGQLLQKTFDWSNYVYRNGWKRLDSLGLAEQIQAFEAQFFQTPDRLTNPASSRTTWTTAYLPYLRKLEAIVATNSQLTLAEAIVATVRSTPLQARSRQVCCTAMASFAEFLNLELPQDLKSFWGNYGTRHAQARHLPSDDLIVEIWATIPNPAWQFVYGIMAAYGLRNHEVFFCDYSALVGGQAMPVIQVQSTTKTGSHDVWAFPPDWIDRFNLRTPLLPAVQTDLSRTTLQRIGQCVTTQFRRYRIPFSPYDLRHAWAVRTIHVGLPDTVAARMMGHSVAVHTRTYHQWLTRRDQQQSVETALRQAR